MEYEHYKRNIESWSNSIIEMEESHSHTHYESSAHYTTEGASLISTTSTYYRTKAFSSQFGINNLINSLDPLLTLATKLRRITIPPDIMILHQNICHEIKAFENKAQTLGYHPPIILAARYVICALLDELISITLWPDAGWKNFSLVEAFHKDKFEGDRFFLILERSLQDPSGHVDLLELIYICLRLGYEGKYREKDRGHFELRNLTEHLYSVINQYREEFSRNLLIAIESPTLVHAKKKVYFHLLPPAWMVSTIMILALLGVFIFFYSKLIKASTPVYQLLNTLQPTMFLNQQKSTRNI